jgi:hypothetical protein
MIATPSEAIEAFHLTFLAQLSKAPNKAVVKGGQPWTRRANRRGLL